MREPLAFIRQGIHLPTAAMFCLSLPSSPQAGSGHPGDTGHQSFIEIPCPLGATCAYWPSPAASGPDVGAAPRNYVVYVNHREERTARWRVETLAPECLWDSTRNLLSVYIYSGLNSLEEGCCRHCRFEVKWITDSWITSDKPARYTPTACSSPRQLRKPRLHEAPKPLSGLPQKIARTFASSATEQNGTLPWVHFQGKSQALLKGVCNVLKCSTAEIRITSPLLCGPLYSTPYKVLSGTDAPMNLTTAIWSGRGTKIILPSQMRKLSLRDSSWLAQDHKANSAEGGGYRKLGFPIQTVFFPRTMYTRLTLLPKN